MRRNAYGRCDLVDVAEAREHARLLMASGMGRRRISHLAGVAESTVSALIHGKRGNPLRRIRRDTARRLLSVARDDLAGGSLVDAGVAWQMLDELIACGVPKARIARALGKKTPALQISRTRVRLSTEQAVAELHWEMWLRSGRLRILCRCSVPDHIATHLEHAHDHYLAA